MPNTVRYDTETNRNYLSVNSLRPFLRCTQLTKQQRCQPSQCPHTGGSLNRYHHQVGYSHASVAGEGCNDLDTSTPHTPSCTNQSTHRLKVRIERLTKSKTPRCDLCTTLKQTPRGKTKIGGTPHKCYRTPYKKP
jgi:hypothetical protein